MLDLGGGLDDKDFVRRGECRAGLPNVVRHAALRAPVVDSVSGPRGMLRGVVGPSRVGADVHACLVAAHEVLVDTLDDIINELGLHGGDLAVQQLRDVLLIFGLAGHLLIPPVERSFDILLLFRRVLGESGGDGGSNEDCPLLGRAAPHRS